MERIVIRARAPQVLAILGLCGFSVAGLIIVAHPGADPRLVSRLTAGGVISVVLWVLWQLGIEPRIVLDSGQIAVHYPFLVRRVGSAQVERVTVERGDLTLRTIAGKKIKPPAYRASILGALSGNRAARAAQREIEHYLTQNGPLTSAELYNTPVLRPWVLIIPLVVLEGEALLAK